VGKAFWRIDLSSRAVSRRSLYLMAKNRYGVEHICCHHPCSRLIVWLLACLALTVERPYHLRRGCAMRRH
jgi:hypothetical protein